MADWIAGPGRAVCGDIGVPGDKSVSHRAIMLAAIADGTSRINGFLEGEDTRATARIFAQLGVHIDAPADGERIVQGVGIDGLSAPSAPLDCGNAGTAMRLLADQGAALRAATEQDRALRPAEIPTNFEQEATPASVRAFKGIRYEMVDSAASGRKEIRWLGEPDPAIWSLPFYGSRPTLTLEPSLWIRPSSAVRYCWLVP